MGAWVKSSERGEVKAQAGCTDGRLDDNVK